MKIKQITISMLVLVLGLCPFACADLVVRWAFEEGQGAVVTDTTGNGNDGAFQGSPEWVAGKDGGGLHFRGDASSDFVAYTLPDGASVWTAGTVAIWVKADVVGQDVWSAPFTNHTPNSAGVQLDVDGGNPGNYRINPGGIVFGPCTTDWIHLTLAWENDAASLYYNGQLATTATLSDSQRTFNEFAVGTNRAHNNWFESTVDDFRVYDNALTAQEVLDVMAGAGPGVVVALANAPAPDHQATDVLRNTVLNWQSGLFAAKHDLYLGTDAATVNDATVPTAPGLTVTSFDPDLLELGQTYYWRVDEVNAAPDNTVFKGDLWSFTVEPVSIVIENITATASGANPGMEASKTVDGSGLNALDQHSVVGTDMWLTFTDGSWIQYEFDKAYKLHDMRVWNSNQLVETFIGFGVKEAVVETSVDGVTWTAVDGVGPFTKASAQNTYEANTTVDLSGIVAKYVKISPQNAHGLTGQSGLSEVRFSYVPTNARELSPADGSTSVSAMVELSWRAGREAASHQIYLGTDSANLTLVDTTDESIFLADGLDYAQTYYWQVVEVNEAETPATYASDVLSFHTPAYGTVDDIESYSGDEGQEVFMTWFDGFGGDATLGGSTTGHIDGPFVETAIVHSGSQSMPVFYANDGSFFNIDGQSSSPVFSEVVREFDSAQDWSAGGIKTLSLFFYGDAATTGQLYCKINNTKVMYDGLSDALQRSQWLPWNIDLVATGANLTNVKSLTLGVEGAGSAGLLYIDDIRLYPLTSTMIDPVLPQDNDPNLVAYYPFEGSPDDAMGNYPGTTVGEPIYVAGKTDQAIQFDGTDDYITNDFEQEELWSAYSVSLWVKTDIMGQEEWRSPFNNNSNGSDFQLDVDGSDPGSYRYNGGAGQAILGPVTRSWTHLAASCDGTQTRVYYNGILVSTLAGADNLFGRIGIGMNRGLNEPFAGVIDEVRVYNRALTDSEVAGLGGVQGSIPASF
jgi:hypothetical protein